MYELAALVRNSAEKSKIGRIELVIFAIKSVTPAHWFFSFCALASSVLLISEKAWFIVPALFTILATLAVNLSANSPCSGISARNASALPNSLP